MHNALFCIENSNCMKKTDKKLVMFRLNSDLLDTLKSAAKCEHRSLNNFVECILRNVMYSEPNEETKAAIEEARAGKNLKKVDMSSFENFMKSLDEIE